MGSDYETSSEEGGAAGQDDYYSDEYSESEEASQPDDEAEEESTSRLGMTEEMSDLGRQSKNGNFPEEKQQFELPFNAVRYLGQALKEIGEINKARAQGKHIVKFKQ